MKSFNLKNIIWSVALIAFVIVLIFQGGCHIQEGDQLIMATYYKTPHKAFVEDDYYNEQCGEFEMELCAPEIDDVALYVYKTEHGYVMTSPLRIKDGKYASIGRYSGSELSEDDNSLKKFSHNRISLSNGKTLYYGLILSELKDEYITEGIDCVDISVENGGKIYNLTVYYFCE